ncbi:MAG: hypothetical protein P4N41_05085 [Negativicutes bacterium]|nr:hypothetical protein [Negativicutes bacterium]
MLLIWHNLSGKKKQFIILFSLAILVLYSLVTFYSASTMYNNRMHASENHVARMNPTAAEPGRTPPDPLPEGGNYATVKIGTYIDDVDSLSIKDSNWTTNFYVWFNWNGDKTLDPGGKMVLVDGVINKKDLLEDYHDINGVNYQRYKISAKIIKFYDTTRVPIENQMLNIYIEDGARDGTKLRFEADSSSNLSSRITIPGYRIIRSSNVVKTHTYRSSYGDPKVEPNAQKVFSQYIYAMEINRIDYGLYIKLFLSLFAALLLTLSSFFIKPSDIGPRFSLPTGAYFGAVANSYVVNSILPSSGSFGLVDHVAGIGLFTIFLSIALSLVSHFLYVRKDEKDLSAVLDRAMFCVVGVSCLIANIVIPLCARG